MLQSQDGLFEFRFLFGVAINVSISLILKPLLIELEHIVKFRILAKQFSCRWRKEIGFALACLAVVDDKEYSLTAPCHRCPLLHGSQSCQCLFPISKSPCVFDTLQLGIVDEFVLVNISSDSLAWECGYKGIDAHLAFWLIAVANQPSQRVQFVKGNEIFVGGRVEGQTIVLRLEEGSLRTINY